LAFRSRRFAPGQTYQCRHAGTDGILERLDRGEAVDLASYYFRSVALFQTSAPTYYRMNRIVAIGVGGRLADGPLYNVLEVR